MSNGKTKDFSVEMTQEQKDRIYYYSQTLKKFFKSYEDLLEEEAEFKRQNDEKLKAQEEKKARAKAVEDAYLEYQKVKEEAYNNIAKAEKNWLELRDKFADDYGGYHMTYINNNGDKKITFDDIVRNFWNW